MAGRGDSGWLDRLSGRDDAALSGWMFWVAVLGFGVLIAAIVVFWPDGGGFIYEGF